MLASVLVLILQNMIEEHGDRIVRASDIDAGFYEITTVEPDGPHYLSDVDSFLLS